MLCPTRCDSFKMDCKLLHQAWKENDKLKIKNWKLEAEFVCRSSPTGHTENRLPEFIVVYMV